MKTTLGYPDRQTSLRILTSGGSRPQSAALAPIITTAAIAEMSQLGQSVHVEPSVLDYIARLVEATRTAEHVRLGVSIRGGLAMARASRVWAASLGRHYVVPDDVKILAIPCLAHRILLDPESEFNGVTAIDVMVKIISEVLPPTERTA
jgi:MoxR-like ATPase